MRRPRLVVLLVFLALASTGPAAPAASDDDQARFTGLDGLLHEHAPPIVGGSDGTYFLGADLDFACGIDRGFERAMKSFSKLVRVIRRSGRTVVFTVAPNKSAVLPDLLARPLPHGICDEAGLAEQARVLRDYPDPSFLPLVDALRRNPHQVYWRTDQHWTTVGGAVLAKRLAAHLDRRLGRQQRYQYGTETRQGELALVLGLGGLETVDTATPATTVEVRTAPGGPDWSGYPEFTFEHAWTSSPARRTWPGRTLILGDSFGWFALENLRPLFRHGHFVWLGHTQTDLPKAIRSSDTVVIELLQLFTPGAPVLSRGFRNAVRKELRR